MILPTLYIDSGYWEKDAQKILDKLLLVKVSKGRCPKSLDDFAYFSVHVLSKEGHLTYALC